MSKTVRLRDAKLAPGEGIGVVPGEGVYAIGTNGTRRLIEKVPSTSTGISLHHEGDGRFRYGFTRTTEPIEQWEAYYRRVRWEADDPQHLDSNEEPFFEAGPDVRKRLVQELGLDRLLGSLRVFYEQGWTRERLSEIYAHADWADEVGAGKAREGLDPLSEYVREILCIEEDVKEMNAPADVRNAVGSWRQRATMLLLLQSQSELERIEREVAERRRNRTGVPKWPRFKRPGRQRLRYFRAEVRRRLLKDAERGGIADPIDAIALVEVAWLLPVRPSSKDPDKQLPKRPELRGLRRGEAKNVVRAALRAARDAIRRVRT